jgi:hypothetical protein
LTSITLPSRRESKSFATPLGREIRIPGREALHGELVGAVKDTSAPGELIDSAHDPGRERELS